MRRSLCNARACSDSETDRDLLDSVRHPAPDTVHANSRPGEFAGFRSTAGADWIGAGAASLAGAGLLQLVTASAARVAISTPTGSRRCARLFVVGWRSMCLIGQAR